MSETKTRNISDAERQALALIATCDPRNFYMCDAASGTEAGLVEGVPYATAEEMIGVWHGRLLHHLSSAHRIALFMRACELHRKRFRKSEDAERAKAAGISTGEVKP